MTRKPKYQDRYFTGDVSKRLAEIKDREKARLSPGDEKGELRLELSANYGDVWSTKELQEEFTVRSFLAPYVFVTRKTDGVPGSLSFTHHPRYYFSFVPD
jgi:hypothetical protein